MKTSELLIFYSVVRKKRQNDGFSCRAINKRIDMINDRLAMEATIRANKLKSYRNHRNV